MIDPIIERCRPHAVTLRDQWEMFTTGTIERLDRIADSVADDGHAYTRHYLRFNLTAGVPLLLAEVPAGEEWLLEYATAQSNIPGSPVSFYDTMADLTTLAGGIPVAALNITIANGPATIGGNGYVFPSGSQITAIFFSGTARGMMQCRATRKVTRRANISAGIRNPDPNRTDQADHNGQRHVGSWVPHPGLSRNAH